MKVLSNVTSIEISNEQIQDEDMPDQANLHIFEPFKCHKPLTTQDHEEMTSDTDDNIKTEYP